MSVTDARAAYARGDWRAAYDALARERDDLDPAALAMLADAAWWLGDSPESMAVSEELYQRLLAAGSDAEAADRALRLAMEWVTRGDLQIGYAWLARARRLLGNVPRCAVHGYILYLEGSGDLDMTGDPEPAAAAAAELEAFAREFDDPALDSFALALSGMAEVRRGHTSAGFAAPGRGHAPGARRPRRRTVVGRPLLHGDPPVRPARPTWPGCGPGPTRSRAGRGPGRRRSCSPGSPGSTSCS